MLATGGMAEIFLAKLQGPEGFERVVVLKRVLPHLARQDQFRQMFLDEARVVSAIAHSNVVQVHELGEDGADLFLVMEYVAGESLTSLLVRLAKRQAPLSPAAAAYIVAEAAAGLHAAHELESPSGEKLGVVHRDVSPHNLMVGYDGSVKVLDFGIAKSSEASQQTASGVLKGKFAYMAPEQYLGHPIDRRTDIFALGTVLWEAVSSRRLFAKGSDGATFRAVCDQPIPRLREVVSDAPEGLDAICARALARDPADRFATAAAMRRALIETMRDVAPTAHPAEEIESLMEAHFAERRDEKREMVRRVSAGVDLTHVPSAEVSTATASAFRASTNRKVTYGLAAVLLLGGILAGVAWGRSANDEVVETPVEASPRQVRIAVDSQPSGAEVRFDGARLGVTPLSAQVEEHARARSLQILLEGHQPYEAQVVADADVRLVVTLVPTPAPTEPDTPPAVAEPPETMETIPVRPSRGMRGDMASPMGTDPEYYRFD